MLVRFLLSIAYVLNKKINLKINTQANNHVTKIDLLHRNNNNNLNNNNNNNLNNNNNNNNNNNIKIVMNRLVNTMMTNNQ